MSHHSVFLWLLNELTVWPPKQSKHIKAPWIEILALMKISVLYGLRWLSVIGSLIRWPETSSLGSFPRVNWVSSFCSSIGPNNHSHNHSPTKTLPVFNSSGRESVGFSSNFFVFNFGNVNARKLNEDSEQGLLPLRCNLLSLRETVFTFPLNSAQFHFNRIIHRLYHKIHQFINHLFRARHSCQHKFKSLAILFKLLY